MFVPATRLLCPLSRKCENTTNLLSNKSALVLYCHYRYVGSTNNTCNNSNSSGDNHDNHAESHVMSGNNANDTLSYSCDSSKKNDSINKWNITHKCKVKEECSEHNKTNLSDESNKDDHNEEERCASMCGVATERKCGVVNQFHRCKDKEMHNQASCNTSHYEKSNEEMLQETEYNIHHETKEHDSITDKYMEKEQPPEQYNVEHLQEQKEWKARINLHSEQLPLEQSSHEATERSRYHKEQEKHQQKCKESEEHNRWSHQSMQKEFLEKSTEEKEEHPINFTSEFEKYDDLYKTLQYKTGEKVAESERQEEQKEQEQLLHKEKEVRLQQENVFYQEESSVGTSEHDAEFPFSRQTAKKSNHRFHHTSKINTITLDKLESASHEADNSNAETETRPTDDKLHRPKLTFDMLTNEPPQSKFSFLAHPDEADTFKFIIHDIVPNNTPKPLLPMWASSLTSPALGKVRLVQHNWVSSDSLGVIEDQHLIDNFVEWVSSCVPAHSHLPHQLHNNVVFHLRRSSCRGLYARHAFRKGDVIFTIPLTPKRTKQKEQQQEMQKTRSTHIIKKQHQQLSQQEEEELVKNNKTNDDKNSENQEAHSTEAQHKDSLTVEENKGITCRMDNINENNGNEKVEDTFDYNNNTENVAKRQNVQKQTSERACNSLLLNTETLSSIQEKQHNEQQLQEKQQYAEEQDSPWQEKQEELKEKKRQHQQELHQSKHFLPSYQFLFDLLMEHDSMTGHMDSNLLEMLNLTMHPLFIEQIYLAMQLACERSAQDASPFYPYLALLSYADDNQIHLYTDDEEIINLHREVIGIKELFEYRDEATRWRYVLAKVHHAWVREYKRQKEKNDNENDNVGNKKHTDRNYYNRDSDNNNIVMVSDANNKAMQIHDENINENSKTVVYKSKAFVDKLKNKVVYQRWWKQRESYKPQTTEDMNSLVSNASSSLLNKIKNYNWFNNHAAESLLTIDNTIISSNSKIIDNSNNKNVMNNTNHESMTNETTSNKQTNSILNSDSECNLRTTEIKQQTLAIHDNHEQELQQEEQEEEQLEMREEPIGAPPSLSDLIWAFRTVLARHRVMSQLRSNTQGEIAQLNVSLNYDTVQNEKVDFFARNVMKLKWALYEKVLGVMDANSLHVNDVDAASIPTLIPLIDMLSHDHRGRGNTYITIEQEQEEEKEDEQQNYKKYNMISKSQEYDSDTNNKVVMDGSNNRSTSKVLVLRAAEDIEEFDEFTTVFPRCESPAFALYKYGFVTSYNEINVDTNSNIINNSSSGKATYGLASSKLSKVTAMEVEKSV